MKTDTDSKARAHELGLCLVIGAALVGLLLGPALVGLDTRLVGYPHSEQAGGAWVLRAAHDALLDGRLPLLAPNVAYPEGGTVHPQSPLMVLMTLPLAPLVGPVALFNLALALSLLLALGGAYLLLRRLGGSFRAALPGALLFVLSPFALDHLAYGPHEVLAAGWIPLCLLAVERLTPAGRASLPAVGARGVAVALAFYAYPYFGIFVTGAAAYLLLARRAPPLWDRLKDATLVLTCAALLVLPLAWSLGRAVEHPRSLIPVKVAGHQRAAHRDLVSDGTARDLAAFLLPTDRYNAPEQRRSVYLSLVALAGCAAALALRVPGAGRWLGLAGLALLFALGGTLRLGGVELPLRLPAHYLCLHLPPFTWISHPFRILPLIHLCLGAGLALLLGRPAGLGSRPAHAAALTALLLADLLLLSPAQIPAPTTPTVAGTAAHRWLAKIPGKFGILDVPRSRENGATGRYLLHQTAHRKLVPYDLDNELPTLDKHPEARAFAEALALSEIERPEQRDLAHEAKVFTCHLPCHGAAALARAGYTYVVLNATGNEALDAALNKCVEACLGEAAFAGSGAIAYESLRRTPSGASQGR